MLRIVLRVPELSRAAEIAGFLIVGFMLGTVTLPSRAADAPTTATSPQTAAEDLAAKRAKLAEQIAKLAPAEDAAADSTEKIAASGAATEAEEALDLLKTLDLLYVQHQATLEQKLEVESQQRRLQGELDALRNFGPPEAKPYSFLLLEDIRDQWGAEAARHEATESDLAAAHQMLEQARERFDECEQERRQTHEALEENDAPDKQAELAKDSKLAETNSTIAQETVTLRRLEIEVKTARQTACKLRQTLLEEKINRIEKDVRFTDRDLKARLTDLTRFAQELKRKLKEAETRLQQLDVQQARAAKELAEASADKSLAAAAHDAFQVARRTLHEEITLIQQRLGELDHFRHNWDRRYDVINGKASALLSRDSPSPSAATSPSWAADLACRPLAPGLQVRVRPAPGTAARLTDWFCALRRASASGRARAQACAGAAVAI